MKNSISEASFHMVAGSLKQEMKIILIIVISQLLVNTFH